MKKPPYVSHYLVLKDLIDGVDVRRYSDTITYLTSRIENIKVDLIKNGIAFVEDITRESKYSTYKPYILYPSLQNMQKAKELLDIYGTKEVLRFLDQKQLILDEVNREN
ncbi:hypothetical protein Arnit_0615 [Arcobacter nitrofigilis DSM 7299]|uniref:Uncharacterized protein n=1 Tax=Arcobacter nitrofigilis (strain ATCC 33309 / DSM 7299 / CCUG 15893 / LMG 7604 / NCTC 12251 / CI) TaxID=572480 RepID=D5V247_ARCNC|nr:hypothetical protein [Arcobacter nitrofigilis]ADG92280.1 hypothetical protein Arnit_0615 [Arcobacter nitrofigilis DSM 7299]